MKTFNKRLSIIIAMLCIGSILFSSCKKNDEEPIVLGNANIRIVNAVSGSIAQDLYQGETKKTTSSVAYGLYSGYLTVDAGNTIISLKNTGSTTVTASSNVGLITNASYTAFYFPTGSGGNGQITGFQDDTTVPASGKIRIRFVNLGAALNNTVNASVSATSTAITTGLAYGYVSAYNTVDANQDIAVTVTGSAVVGIIPGVQLQAGKIYTVWFDAASTSSVNIHVVQQN